MQHGRTQGTRANACMLFFIHGGQAMEKIDGDPDASRIVRCGGQDVEKIKPYIERTPYSYCNGNGG